MSIQLQTVATIMVLTDDLNLKYTANFFETLKVNGDAITISTLDTAATIKLVDMSLSKTEAESTGDSNAGTPALQSEAGAHVLSLPAYSTSEPIILDRLIDFLRITTDPVLPSGICVTLHRCFFDGKMRTSDYVY